MWDTLEPELIQRLSIMQDDQSVSQKVKSTLVETLAGGTTTSAQVAGRLCMSTRSLQRRLSEEGTTYKQLLNETRLELAQHYLAKPNICLGEISYLLGFKDQTSFYRAYQGWTGTTPSKVRDRADVIA